MKTHLILVKTGGADPSATLGFVSRSGRIFLRMAEPLPEGENIALKLLGPANASHLLDGIIVACFRTQDGQFHLQADFSHSIATFFLQMEGQDAPVKAAMPSAPAKSRVSSASRTAKKTPAKNGKKFPGSALSSEDMRQIVSQDEMTIVPAPPDETPLFVPAVIGKKTLTDQERKIAEPVGKFLMNLTKAMCRSGYYDPEHPSSASAKKGLYEEFIQNAGQYNEIMFTREKSRKTLDIAIAGVTDDQVSVRMLVGQGVAELFLPKLSDYYDRKGLISFAIRKGINLDHFDRFIDIMSDPKVDRQETSKVGDLLTNALVENGITEISTVFISDRIELGQDLPWRVEMAIQRLAKDFMVMPMFKNVSTDVLSKLKMQTIADILRPLRHPRLYSDFLVNCHVIAREVKDVPSEEIERMIVDAFPLEQLIPTSHFTFAELGRLEKQKTEEAATGEVSHRLTSIRRILKIVARRVAVDRPKGAVHFLADLFKNSILAFEDLPPEARYLVNSHRLVDDIIADFSKYERGLRDPKTPEDAVVCLKCFRRAAPILIEEKAFEALLRISGLIREVATGKTLQSDSVRHELENVQNRLETAMDAPETGDAIEPSTLFYFFVFGDTSDLLISVFDQADVGEHKTIGSFLESIGLLGVRILSRVLTESKKRESRKFAVESMIGIGEMSRKWALRVIANKNNAWYLHRNAMMILRHVSRHPEDFEMVRIFVAHEKPRLREEAVGLIIALRPSDTESLIIELLDDPEPKMRWRAARALADISPISGNAITEIMEIITGPPSGGRKIVVEHKKKIVNLISAINGMSDIPNTFRVETGLISLMESITEQEKGVLKIFKRGTITDEDIGVIKAAVPLLGRIGTAASETELNKMRRTVPHLAEEIDAALKKIKTRDGR